MEQRKGLPVRQAVSILVACQLLEVLTWLPEVAGLSQPGDLLFVVLFSAVVQALLLLPLYFLLRWRQMNTLPRFAAGMYSAYFLFIALYMLFCGYIFLSRVVMPQTNGLLLIGLLLVSGCYIAAREREALMKTGSFFATGMVIISLAFFVLSLPDIDITQLHGTISSNETLWEFALKGALRSTMAPILLVLLSDKMEIGGKTIWMSWGLFFVLFFLISVTTVAVLGVVSQLVLFPVFLQVTTLGIDGMIQRMDIVWIAGWGMALFVALGTCIHCGQYCLRRINLNGGIVFNALMIVGALTVYVYAAQEQIQNALRQGWLIPAVQAFFVVFFPALLLLFRKGGQEKRIPVQKIKK